MTTRSDLIFDTEMSVRYHRRRAAFLERVGNLMTAATLIGGAGAFASVTAGHELVAQIVALCITVVGIIQATYRVETCAAQHRQWLGKWLALRAQQEREPEASPQRVAEWVDIKLGIEAECVCEMRALQEDCFNKTMHALDRQGSPVRITRLQRWFMQIHSFENGFDRSPF